MKKYTEKIHAERLIKILEKKDTCNRCPAASRFDGGKEPKDLWSENSNPCKICCNFINLTEKNKACPCDEFGSKGAARLTWIALEEKGYI